MATKKDMLIELQSKLEKIALLEAQLEASEKKVKEKQKRKEALEFIEYNWNVAYRYVTEELGFDHISPIGALKELRYERSSLIKQLDAIGNSKLVKVVVSQAIEIASLRGEQEE